MITVTTPTDLAIPVVQALDCLRSGTPLVIGVMSAGLVAESCEVSRFDNRNKTGYQREPSKSRVNRLADALKNKQVDLPTAILLNLRLFTEGEHLSEDGDMTFFHPNSAELRVVDGQHRILALKKLVEENPDEWRAFKIPFVCMLGADEREEMEQFFIVNSTAKSVRTDLALSLLKQRAESDAGVMDSLMAHGESWKVTAQTIVEELCNCKTWRNRIRFPGEARDTTTIANAGMANSLRPLLATPYFGQLTTTNQLKILDAYWQGIAKGIPEAFTSSNEFLIQKSTGVMIFHGLLITVIEVIRSRGQSVIDAETYEEVLSEALLEMEGDTSDGGIASGLDFWRSGPEGAAGSYSSNAGRRVLLAKLRGKLPTIEVEIV